MNCFLRISHRRAFRARDLMLLAWFLVAAVGGVVPAKAGCKPWEVGTIRGCQDHATLKVYEGDHDPTGMEECWTREEGTCSCLRGQNVTSYSCGSCTQIDAKKITRCVTLSEEEHKRSVANRPLDSFIF